MVRKRCAGPETLAHDIPEHCKVNVKHLTSLFCLQVLSQLEQCTKYPDFNNYLAYIFADGDRFSIEASYTTPRQHILLSFAANIVLCMGCHCG